MLFVIKFQYLYWFYFSFFSDLKDLVLANDKRLLKIGLGVVTVTGVGFIVYKVVKNYSQ
jgi:hypothetical protein